jgi:hypothetical protein
MVDARIHVIVFCSTRMVDGKEIKNGSVLDSTNHVYVTVVNSEVHKNGSCGAIQPRVVFEVTDRRFCVNFILWEIEIKSAVSVVRDFTLVEYALCLRAIGIHPSVHAETEFRTNITIK